MPMECDEKLLAEIAEMMSAHVENWPAPKKIRTAISLIDKTLAASRNEVEELREALTKLIHACDRLCSSFREMERREALRIKPETPHAN